jgi:cell division protein FtsW
VLVAATAVLVAFGSLMVLSASSVDALQLYGSPWFIFGLQVLYAAVGCGVAFVCSRISDLARVVSKVIPWLLAVTFALLVAVEFKGQRAYGASRWLAVGPFHVQPSEIAKLTLVLYLAAALSRLPGRLKAKGRHLLAVLVPAGVAFALAGLVVIQPDFGTAAVLAGTALFMMAYSRVPAGFILRVGLLLGVSGVAVAFAAPYRRARLLSFLDPFARARSNGYQVVQSLVSLGSGHIFGEGLGASTAKWGFLPNDHTDFILAVVGQELGLVGTLFVLVVFAVLVVACFFVSFRASSEFGRLMAGGVAAWLGIQGLLNVGTVVGLLPVTGVPLPFVSYGGSSLVVNLAAIGLVLALDRR